MTSSNLKYIAKQLGISVSTVSRALNGKPGVKPETREKILEAAREYNYIPNEVARSLQKSSTNTIAVVLPDISEVFFGIIVKEIDRLAAELGYMILLADTHEKVSQEQKYVDMLFERRIDALVLATVCMDGHTVKRFVQSRKPVVCIDNIPQMQEIDSVTIDNREASRLAVKHLAENGHCRIAGIFGSLKETTGSERYNGYLEELECCGFQPDPQLAEFGDYKRDSGYRCMKNLLEKRKKHPFTAVYITSEKMTFGAMAAMQEAGLKIPEDLSLIGFDIHETENSFAKRIVSIRQPEVAIGKKVGELLLKKLAAAEEESYSQEAERVLLSPYLQEGETVARIG